MSFFRIDLFLILCVFCITLTDSTLLHRGYRRNKTICEKSHPFKRRCNKKEESNLKKITERNELYTKKIVTLETAMNKYEDVSNELLTNGSYNYKKDYSIQDRSKRSLKKKCSPKHFDWRERGAVTAVKDHGNVCNCGYAFSAVGVIEGQYYKKTRNLKSFSAQQIVDCSSSYDNHGCNYGLPKNAFKYLKMQHEMLQTEENFGYHGKKSKCGYDAMGNKRIYKPYGPKIKSYKQILPVCEAKLKYTVATYGPVSVVVELNEDFIKNYRGGVFYSEKPTEEYLLKQGIHFHSMLLVGYGTDPHEGDYWILKNYWGTEWGENGYMRLARNRGNHRGIASRAYIAYLE